MSFDGLTTTGNPHLPKVDELKDMYFYINVKGKLEVIRRDIINDLLRGRRDLIIN